MRTLNRPMFNMGGPIKEGVMHGIREPYRGGQLVRPGPGRQGYQGAVGTGINVAKWLATLGSRAGKTFQGVGRGYNLGKIGSGAGRNLPSVIKPPGTGWTTVPGSSVGKEIMTIPQKGWGARIGEKISGAIPARLKSWVTGDPLYKTIAGGTTMAGRGAKWTGKKLYETGKYGLTTPSGLALTGASIYFWPDGTKKTKEELKAQGLDQHGPFDHSDKKKIAKATAAFAEAQRDTRVKKYLDMMGYDRSKKTAVADALIDASKIVSDRGTLEKKNITRDLINPIIQATSKRFDKPEQIREAVGLMSVKAAITKDLEDPSIKALRLEQLKALKGGFAKDIGDFVLSAKGQKIKPEALERIARARAHEHNLDFTVVTDADIAGVGKDASLEKIIQTAVKDDGVYMIGDAIIQVTGGIPKQIA